MTTPPVNGYDYIPGSPTLQPGGIVPSSSPKDIPSLPTAMLSMSAGTGGGDTASLLGDNKSLLAPVIKSKAETFDFVIVATGHHWKPKLPDFPGVDKFKGGMMHSHSYRV
jgi:hypothetical protein